MNKKIKVFIINLLILSWLFVFHYESIRHFYLQPLFKKELVKVPLLFPPAGWIMFYRVNKSFGKRDVFAKKNNQIIYLDPHSIFPVPTIGFDNIKRGVLSSAAAPRSGKLFCRYLFNHFSDADEFVVQLSYYPDVTKKELPLQKVEYVCHDQ